MNKQIFAAALLAATAVAPAAAFAQNYGDGHGWNPGSSNGGYGDRTQGTIAAVRGGNIQLTNGRNIFLHNGTVINPTGTSLQPGQQIFITGSRGGNGAINADQIDVNGYGNNRYGGWNNDDRDWQRRHERRDGDDHRDGGDQGDNNR